MVLDLVLAACCKDGPCYHDHDDQCQYNSFLHGFSSSRLDPLRTEPVTRIYAGSGGRFHSVPSGAGNARYGTSNARCAVGSSHST